MMPPAPVVRSTLSVEKRFENLRRLVAAGQIDPFPGRPRVSTHVLAALSPEVRSSGRLSAFPYDILPRWFVEFTVAISWNQSSEEWPHIIAEWALVAERANALLSPKDWDELGIHTRASVLEIALPVAGRYAGAVQATIDLMRNTSSLDDDASVAAWLAHRDTLWDLWINSDPRRYELWVRTPEIDALSAARDTMALPPCQYSTFELVGSLVAAAVSKSRPWQESRKEPIWDDLARAVLRDVDRRCDLREHGGGNMRGSAS